MDTPEPCERLRKALIELIVHADIMAGNNAECALAPESRQHRHQSEGHQQMTELKRLIAKARDSIVGVAQEIDPLQGGPPGRWTSELKQHLANLDGLLLRCGWRVSTYDPENYHATMRAIQDAQCYLGTADYSARQLTRSVAEPPLAPKYLINNSSVGISESGGTLYQTAAPGNRKSIVAYLKSWYGVLASLASIGLAWYGLHLQFGVWFFGLK